LKAAIRAECEGAVESEGAVLQRRRAELDAQIQRGAKRLLSAPDSVYTELVAELDGAKREKAELEDRLDVLGRARSVSAVDIDRMVVLALEKLDSLEAAIYDADPLMVRDALAGLVSHIELHFRHEPRPRTVRTAFDHGIIYVRPGLENGNSVSSVQPMTLANSVIRNFSRPIALSWSSTLLETE
jgi:hypothetical protein